MEWRWGGGGLRGVGGIVARVVSAVQGLRVKRLIVSSVYRSAAYRK